jgi:hypothetical protein
MDSNCNDYLDIYKKSGAIQGWRQVWKADRLMCYFWSSEAGFSVVASFGVSDGGTFSSFGSGYPASLAYPGEPGISGQFGSGW